MLANSSAWWLGDWLIYGRENFPDRYKTAMRKTALDYQTLRNYAWVAGRFPLSRRRDMLSFQHHATVAALPDADQDLWLDRATYNHWSKAQLRAQLKAASIEAGDRDRGSAAALQLKVTNNSLDRWEAAARKQQLNLIDWIVTVMDGAAKQILDAP